MNDDLWRARIGRVVGGEYPHQVYPKVEALVVDIQTMYLRLCAAETDMVAMRSRVKNRIDTLLAEAANASVALTRKLEAARQVAS